MNYRHAYHAGNFADVLKHIVLVRVIDYLKRKSTPFRVIDTHAGCGTYDLSSDEASKTGEWQHGIGKLTKAKLSPDVRALLDPYLDVIWAHNVGQVLKTYPGSPAIAAHVLRPTDRLIVNEWHQTDGQDLQRHFSRTRNVKVLGADGWTVLKSVLPPRERRGVTLIDPPFEQVGEFDRLAQAVRDHQRRFATGVLMLWFPIKNRKVVNSFYDQIRAQNLKNCLLCELAVDKIYEDGHVKATGLVVVNPPFPLADELMIILPALCTTLRQSPAATHTLAWLSGDEAASQ